MIDMGNTNAVGANVMPMQGPALPGMFSRYRVGLREELRAAVPALQLQAPEQGGLYSMLQYHMGWADAEGSPLSELTAQGKAVRPTLCLFACEALAEEYTRALPAAAALELIHNFSLIHDDIQDGDTERRHQPTVWALWGQPRALVAGNAMRSLADTTALRLTERGIAEDKALMASCLLTESYLEMTKGQCLDLAFESSLEIDLEDYLTMISCKTGALIRCGMEIGALIAADSEAFARAFADCGKFLGLAFQVRDDVLGIWGDGAATGKGVGNDILRKKKSFPIVYALGVAGEPAKQRLVDVYHKAALDDYDVQDVLTVLDDLNVAGYAHEVTRRNADLALDGVSQVPLPSWAREEIEELAEFLAARQY